METAVPALPLLSKPLLAFNLSQVASQLLVYLLLLELQLIEQLFVLLELLLVERVLLASQIRAFDDLSDVVNNVFVQRVVVHFVRHQKDFKFHVEALDLLIRFGLLQALDADLLSFGHAVHFDLGLCFLAKGLLDFDFRSFFEVGLQTLLLKDFVVNLFLSANLLRWLFRQHCHFGLNLV